VVHRPLWPRAGISQTRLFTGIRLTATARWKHWLQASEDHSAIGAELIGTPLCSAGGITNLFVFGFANGMPWSTAWCGEARAYAGYFCAKYATTLYPSI
jgi:hypothetical protein